MIKKLLLLTLTLSVNPIFCKQQAIVKRGQYPIPMQRAENPIVSNVTEPIIVEDTGFYWTYVQQMPSYWSFWKRWKAIGIIAAYAKTSTQEILRNIDLQFPVLITTNLQEAQRLQAGLLPLGCSLEIHEVAFSFSSTKDAEYFIKQRAEQCKNEPAD